MEFLFEDLNLEDLQPFVCPNNEQITEYLKTTSGIVTKTIYIYLNLEVSTNVIDYNGPLTPAQEIYILNELSDDNIQFKNLKY